MALRSKLCSYWEKYALNQRKMSQIFRFSIEDIYNGTKAKTTIRGPLLSQNPCCHMLSNLINKYTSSKYC